MPGPLDGVRVLEVASFVFVPGVGRHPRRLGRRRAEGRAPGVGRPGPRRSRPGACRPTSTASSHLFEVSNRGKRAIGLDINTAEGREILMSLVDTADVFLTNLLPAARTEAGHRARRHAGPATRGSSTGGARPRARAGPLAGKGGFDGITYWGRSGAAIGVTPPGQEFPSPMPGPGFGDLQSGMAMAGGIGAALFQRERTGTGTIVDVSLMSAGLWAMGMTISGASVLDVDELPHQGHFASPNPLTNQYRTKDGHFIALGFLQADRYWPEFCLVVDRLEWIADERFATLEIARRQRRGVRGPARRAVRRAHPGRVGGGALAPAGPVGRVPPGRPDPLRRAGAGQRVRPGVEHDDDGKVVLVPAPAQFGGDVTQLGNGPEARRRHRRRARASSGCERRRRSPSCGRGGRRLSRREFVMRKVDSSGQRAWFHRGPGERRRGRASKEGWT